MSCVLVVGVALGVHWLLSKSTNQRDAWLVEWTAEGKRAAARTEIDGYLTNKLIPAQAISCGPQDSVVVLAGSACSESVILVRSSERGGEARLRPPRGAGYRWQGAFHRDIDMTLNHRQSAQIRELAKQTLVLPDACTSGCTTIPCLQSGFAACAGGDWRAAYGPPERSGEEEDRRRPGSELWAQVMTILQVEPMSDPDNYVICM